MAAGFSAGHANAGRPYGYPERYQAFGVFSPLRRRRARRLSAAQTLGYWAGQTVPAYGYSAGAPTAAAASCRGIFARCIRDRIAARRGEGATAPGLAGYRTARFGGETGASAKSAMAVRRFNLMARSRGYGVGMPTPGVRPRVNEDWPQQNRAYGYPWLPPDGGVFYGSQNPVRARERRREHPSGWQNGFAVGAQAPGVRPRVNEDWPKHHGFSVGCDGEKCGCDCG